MESELRNTIASMETELKANRGTIARLAAEAGQQHKSASEYLSQIQALFKEKEEQETTRKNLTKLIDDLRVTQSKKDEEIIDLKQQMENLRENINAATTSVSEVELSNRRLKDFKEDIAKLISAGISDEEIFLRISGLREIEDRYSIIKVENERMLIDIKNLPSISDTSRLKRDIAMLEDDLNESRSLMEKMRRDEKKFLEFTSNLGNILGVEKSEFDPSLEAFIEAMLLRANQLSRNEGALTSDQKTQIYSLQRKIKSLNENLESKNFHLDLLKKKLASLEKQKINKSDFEKEKDEACTKVKKLMKLVENYKKELTRVERETRDLKERLSTALVLATDNHAKESTLEELTLQKLDLESVCKDLNGKMELQRRANNKGIDEQEVKVRGLVAELDRKSATLTKYEEVIKKMKIFKQRLTEMLSEESFPQVKFNSKDFLSTATDPNQSEPSDEEILERVKHVIDTNKQNAATAYVLDSAFSDMAEGLKAGYRKAAMNVPKEVVPRDSTIGSFERNLRTFMARPQTEFP